MAGELSLPQNIRTVNVDFALSPGRAGVLKSDFSADMKNVAVSAIAYDVRGVIIGGGQTSLGRVPAMGQAAVAVPVIVTGLSVRVAIYPALST
ncbi:MAG: hypothetical protein LC793_04760 [Thermomicrobia bacterium]|nr:hypothetical protein [Thermomicrobia bacterium]MCA1723069.1 hypothetical protein [Thermomicrobia bacterium]